MANVNPNTRPKRTESKNLVVFQTTGQVIRVYFATIKVGNLCHTNDKSLTTITPIDIENMVGHTNLRSLQ